LQTYGRRSIVAEGDEGGAKGIEQSFSKKLGPLPIWAWGALAGGAVWWFFIRGKKGGAGPTVASYLGQGAAGPAVVDAGATGASTGSGGASVGGGDTGTTPTTGGTGGGQTTVGTPPVTSDPLRPAWVLAQQAEAMAQPGNLLAPAYNALGATAFNQLSTPQQVAASQQLSPRLFSSPPVAGPGNAGQQYGSVAAAIGPPTAPPPGTLVPYVGGPYNGQLRPLV
jgi:hypothetical protein